MALDTNKCVITKSPVLMYPYPSKEYHFFTNDLDHTWSGILTQQWSNSEISGNEDLSFHPVTYQVVPSLLHKLNGL